MKVTWKNPEEVSEKARRDKIRSIIGASGSANIFSRLQTQNEVVAVVRSSANVVLDEQTFYFVWLSSREDGSYVNADGYTLEEVIDTLIRGEWIYQPKAEMVLNWSGVEI